MLAQFAFVLFVWRDTIWIRYGAWIATVDATTQRRALGRKFLGSKGFVKNATWADSGYARV